MVLCEYTGWPEEKTPEQSIQSIFQDFAVINSYLCSVMDCHFRDLPDFQSSEARLMTN